ncbi:MAG: hypothetical protein ABSF70_02145 [Terracidiphilus sp.]|jgi:hypothetical protein
MNETAMSKELAKLTSLTNRVVYRLVKATVMSLVLGFIAGWKAGFCLLLLILCVDSLEDSFSKSCRRRGFRFSLIFLLCVLVFSCLAFVLYYKLFPSREIASMMAWFGLLAGSTCMDIVATVKTRKDAL